MIISYFLAQTLVPILSNWLLKEEKYKYKHGQYHAHAGEALDAREVEQVRMHAEEDTNHPEENDLFEKIKVRFTKVLNKMMPKRKAVVVIYLFTVIGLVAVCMGFIGRDMMPRTNTGQFQIRLKEPDGTRLEVTEAALKDLLKIIDSTVDNHVAVTSAYVGLVPSSYGTSNLYVFNTGTHEAVVQVNLDEDYKINLDELKDVLRKNIQYKLPEARIIFEPIDLTDKIMSQGATTPIEVRVAGKDIDQIHVYADSLVSKLTRVPYLRDVQIQQPLAFPTVAINIDRFKASQFGLSVQEIARSVTASTSSSRFTEKNQWLDEKAAYTYQVQVQIPEYAMSTIDHLKEIPLIKGQNRPILSDVADFKMVNAAGEYDRSGPRRFLTVNANLSKVDLGTATTEVQKIVKGMGQPAKGVTIALKGMSDLLTETLSSLQTGLLFAVVVILLLLTATYESLKLGMVVLVTAPAVILGSLLLLLVTGSTLNLQSYMGMIMSIGVSVANAILIVTNAEKLRLEYSEAKKAAVVAASIRLRPILMTSLAMIAGMIPMASGMGEAGEQTAPLGRAVIGGLIASTLAALYILPLAFAWIQNKSSLQSPSLLPKLKTMKPSTSLVPLNIIIIAVSLFITSCSGKQKPVDLTKKNTSGVKDAASENKTELAALVQRSIGSYVQLPGELSAFESIDVFPKVSGYIKNVYVDRGSAVRKGQLLMILDAPEINQQVQTAKSNLAKANELYLISKDRYERLLQTSKTPGTVSPFELNSAKLKMTSDAATVQAERSTVTGLGQMKSYLEVRAPFSGIITERNVHPGALVGPSTKTGDKPMLSLQQLDHLRLVVNIPETVVSSIHNGDKVEFKLNAYPDKTFSAVVSRRSGVINTAVRSEAIEFDVPSEGGQVKPGMYSEVKIPLKSSNNSYVVPSTAIVHSPKGVYVVAVDDKKKTKFVNVQEGINAKDSTAVFGDLKGIATIIKHPSTEVEEGSIIQ
jgi:RND family efflux transporter MFP subunit